MLVLPGLTTFVFACLKTNPTLFRFMKAVVINFLNPDLAILLTLHEGTQIPQ